MREVLTDLPGLEAQKVGKFLTRGALDAALGEVQRSPKINWQAPDCLIWNLTVPHRTSSQ
jgi:hypothetical protein